MLKAKEKETLVFNRTFGYFQFFHKNYAYVWTPSNMCVNQVEA